MRYYWIICKGLNPPYVVGNKLAFPLDEAVKKVRSGGFGVLPGCDGEDELRAAIEADEIASGLHPPRAGAKKRTTKKRAAKKTAKKKATSKAK